MINTSHNRLYIDSHWISPYAFSAFVALTEKSVPFEVVELAFDKKEQLQDGYPKQSFTGRIPAYVEGDFWLAESSAIVEYVEEKYAAPSHPRLLHQWQRSSVRTFVEHKRRPFTPYSY